MKLMEWINQKRITIFYYLFRIFPIQKNKVVFCNYVGKGYGCNPKYIAEEMRKQKNNWKLIWMTKDLNNIFPLGIHSVKYESIRAIYELSTAGVWIDNQRKLPYNKKRKKQFFLETWHGGGGPIKKIGADNPANFDNKPYQKTSLYMDKITDLMISNSHACTEIFHRAFLYTGEILECGYPRNDILVSGWEPYHDILCDFFHQPKTKKLALYAPTYRKGRMLDKYQLDGESLLKALKQKFRGDWLLLFRLHPTMKQKECELLHSDCILSASKYEDTQELLAGCDILISDYSSVISEFAIMKKPVFLFATDIKEYAIERDFYMDYYTLPFPIAETNEQLINNIISFDLNNYEQKRKAYFKAIGMCESGNAAKQIVDRIQKEINK